MDYEYLKNSLKLGVIGSRNLPDNITQTMKQSIIDFIISKNLDKNGTKNIFIVSGGARGADKISEVIAEEMQWDKLVFNAKWNNKDGSTNKGAGFDRNSRIVDFSDAIIAFQKDDSRGTQDSINKARQQKKLLRVIKLSTTHR